jgi:acyl carrier protein
MRTLAEVLAMSDQNLQETIIQLAAAALGKKLGRLRPDAPMFSSQDGFDSIALMEFILRLEDAFGIEIPDEDLDPDIFYSVETVAAYVLARLESRG